MVPPADPAELAALAGQARQLYTETLVDGVAGVVQKCRDAAQELADKGSEPALRQRRRELLEQLVRGADAWARATVQALRQTLLPPPVRPAGAITVPAAMELVDDDTIEREIMASRLALAIMERAAAEYADVGARIAGLERRADLDARDPLRAHVTAHILVDAWRAAGQTVSSWQDLRATLHAEFAQLVESAWRAVNRWLLDRQVPSPGDSRPLVLVRTPESPRREGGLASGLPTGSSGSSGTGGFAGGDVVAGGSGGGNGLDPTLERRSNGQGRPTSVGDETRLMTRAHVLRGTAAAGAVMQRLNHLAMSQAPRFGHSTVAARSMSPGLAQAMETQALVLRERAWRGGGDTVQDAPPSLLEDLQRRKRVLKQAAATPEERATIEIVALLFQSILTDDRIPASVRVWFARLQMPVLRVAVTEPDFFATLDHPARQLIDRMGACVMGFEGFDSAFQNVGDALEKEIKRVVQVVEAYPDTGRRVFQAVLTEFEAFLEHYFSNQNEATRRGVSLAQQVEQRETLAIQYTIELRRMLNEMPVQDGVRQFLFQVWADVLATMALRHGAQGEPTRAMKRAAAELIGSASAKVTPEERADVIRKLPTLLKALREGMSSAGVEVAKQELHIQQLNNSLAAAFTARPGAIPKERLDELTERLESLEEMLPESRDLTSDELLGLDLADYESSEFEVVSEGGSMPTLAMMSQAGELKVGGWYMLDYRNRNEPVQLAWHGLRKQLSLFVTPQGRCVLFQLHRLAAFLQAGLLLPAQDEALTVRASRDALAKLDADVSRLLG